MAEYIKRKILVDLVLSKLRFMGDARIMNKNDERVLSEIDGYEKAMDAVHQLLLDEDLIEDIEPVKHGRWIEITPKHSRCSVCDTTCLIAVYPISKGANYCPNCGARMDGQEVEEDA